MTTGAMLRYPSMSIRLPQWTNEAPRAPDASSIDGSTVRPVEKPVAAEYIKPDSSSNVIAAAANPIAARLDVLVLMGAFPGADQPVWLEFGFRDVACGPTLRGTRGILR